MKHLQEEQTTIMDQLMQADSKDSSKLFADMIQKTVRTAIYDMVRSEVDQLCGGKHHPDSDSVFHRAGSAPSIGYVNGEPAALTRPRVREKTSQGKSKEVQLKSWAALQDPEQKEEAIMRAVLCGVSTRKVKDLHEKDLHGMSKSAVSRLWAEKAALLLEEFNQSDLSDEPIAVLMLDGVFLAKGLTAIVALGILPDGSKRLLGFNVGVSENTEVCKDLLGSLVKRGLHTKPGHRLLAVLDGSEALEKSTRHYFCDALIQRCLVHKERNLRGYLSKKDHGAIARYFARLRKAQGKQTAKEILEELEVFLLPKNKLAYNSLQEAGEQLITLHSLNVPSTLNGSLLSTNAIENVMRNLRSHSGRVCRWRKQTNQAGLWLASGLILAQKGFHRIRGCSDLPELMKSLKRDPNRRAPLGGLPQKEEEKNLDTTSNIFNPTKEAMAA